MHADPMDRPAGDRPAGDRPAGDRPAAGRSPDSGRRAAGGAGLPVAVPRRGPGGGLPALPSKVATRPRSLWQRLRDSVAPKIFETGLYNYFLSDSPPKDLGFRPKSRLPGDAEQGLRLLDGVIRLQGMESDLPQEDPWGSEPPDAGIAAWLHGFEFLRDLYAVTGERQDQAAERARRLVGAWLSRHPRWHRLCWRTDILSIRLLNWLTFAEPLLRGADAAFRKAFLEGLARQARHLSDALRLRQSGVEPVLAWAALCTATLCLPDLERRREAAFAGLTRVLHAEILPDGMHRSRNPSRQFRLLAILAGLRRTCLDANWEAPEALANAVDRMAPMLRALRHGDGGLAVFHDGIEERSSRIDAVLKLAESRAKPLESAPYGQYERAEAKRAVLLMDVGWPVPDTTDSPHLSPLAMEFSHGRDRIIVNCGTAADPLWRQALAGTAAHSTMSIADEEALPEGWLAAPPPPPPPTVTRQIQDGNFWIEGEHAGYESRFGLRHRRRLYLHADGDDLRGEDMVRKLRRPDGSRPEDRSFAIRFHLHPDIRVSLLHDGAQAILKTVSGKGWRMRVAGGTVSLEDSVYLGADGIRHRSQQILLCATTSGDTTIVKWALAKLTG